MRANPWAIALRAIANGQTSCVLEMEVELQEQRALGTLHGEQADLGSPHLFPGRERRQLRAQEVSIHWCAENSTLNSGLHPVLENSDSERKHCDVFPGTTHTN